MATKSFKDICVEYATQLGKGLPLTPGEMCNAVIMYLNSQITEMQSITTALQTAVTEAESSATEALNTANGASEKVDTLQTNVTEAESNATEALNTANGASEKVDTLQTNVTEAESKATEALNTANSVSGKVNALPKVPTPTTSDNGKIIGVQSGAYALVEQSGGEVPANMVTTDTEQTIYGYKNFVNDIGVTSGSRIRMSVLSITNDWVQYYSTTIRFPNKGQIETTFATTDDIPSYTDPRNVTYSRETGATITYGTDNAKEFVLPIIAGDNITIDADETNTHLVIKTESGGAPANMVTTDTSQTITGGKTFISDVVISGAPCVFSIRANDGPGSYTHYGHKYIMVGESTPTTRYILDIPNKNGTIATLDDIPTPVTKYFTRVICNDTNTNTLCIFSCITEGDLSGNNVYGDVVSLLTELGAINPTSALPCSGKTSAGGAVIGVYTDGSAITVFGGDSATEEIPTTAEINIISK